MKKILFILVLALVFFYSCEKHEDLYCCTAAISCDPAIVLPQIVTECGLTSEEAEILKGLMPHETIIYSDPIHTYTMYYTVVCTKQ